MTAQPPNTPTTALAQATAKWELIIGSVEPEFTSLAEANGNLVKFAIESRFARDIIVANDALQRCPTDSVIKAVRNVAAIGLSLNPAMKLAYLVPRDGQCCLDISYRGLVKIAVDSGSILGGAKSVIVRKNDQFEYMGPFAMPLHKIALDKSDAERGDIVACYCAAPLPNANGQFSGLFMIELMTKDEIDEIRHFALAKAKNPQNPALPWNRSYAEMAKKSTTRRSSKSWAATERLSAAVALLDENDGGIIEHDITPGAPQLTQSRPGRPDPATFVQANQQQQTADDGSTAREAFLSDLETKVRERGQSYYAGIYKDLTRQQRIWLGTDGHQRMWDIGHEVDTASFDAQQAAAAQQS